MTEDSFLSQPTEPTGKQISALLRQTERDLLFPTPHDNQNRELIPCFVCGEKYRSPFATNVRRHVLTWHADSWPTRPRGWASPRGLSRAEAMRLLSKAVLRAQREKQASIRSELAKGGPP